MRKVETAYLHHREISAQEAVFRVTGLRLRECSRKIEFVPVGENPCRMSIPLKEVQKKQNTSKRNIQNFTAESNCLDDESEIWMKNMSDRYKGRHDNSFSGNVSCKIVCRLLSCGWITFAPKNKRINNI